MTQVFKTVFYLEKNIVPGISMYESELLIIKESLFENLISLERGAFKLVDTPAIIKDCKFVSVFAKYGTIINAIKIETFIIFEGNIVDNCSSKIIGSLMELKNVAKLILFNNTFSNLFETLLIFAIDSNIILSSNEVSNFYSNFKNKAGLFYMKNSSLFMISNSIQNLTVIAHMPLIFGKNSDLNIQNCYFKNINCSDFQIIFLFFSSKIKIAKTKFAYYNKGLFYLHESELILFQCLIFNNNSYNQITSYDDIFSSFYLLNSSCSIISSHFHKNRNQILKRAGVIIINDF